MEKNKNHELDVVLLCLYIWSTLPPWLTLSSPSLFSVFSLRGAPVDMRGGISEALSWSWGPPEVSSYLGAVREVAIDYTPIVVKDLFLKLLEPTIDEGGDLTEDCQRATGYNEDIVHHILLIFLFILVFESFVFKFLSLLLKTRVHLKISLAGYSLHLGPDPIVPVQAGVGAIRPVYWVVLIVHRIGISKRSRVMLTDTARYYQILLDTVQYSQILPGTARYCQKLQDTAKYCQIVPDTTRYCQILTDTDR